MTVIKLHGIKAMLAILAIFASTALIAQNQYGKVEVKKDYESDLTGAKKRALKVDFSDTLKKFDLNMSYRIQDKQLRDLYAFTPMPSAKISAENIDEIPSFMAKVGVALPLAPTFGVWYQPMVGNADLVTLKAIHDSYHDKSKIADINTSNKVYATDNDVQAKNWKNTIGAQYTHIWDNAQINAGINFHNAGYYYYGIDLTKYAQVAIIPDFAEFRSKDFMKKNMSHKYNQIEATLGVNSIESENYAGKFHYNGKVSFTSTADNAKFLIIPEDILLPMPTEPYNAKLTENLLIASLEFGPTVGRYSMITAGISSQSAFYSQEQNYHLSLLDATLIYKLRRNGFSMDLGAKISFSFNNKSGSDKYHNYVSPKVSINYNIENSKTWLYAIADGGNSINSYASLMERCPYISPVIDLRESGTPLYTKVGIKGMASAELDFDLYVGAAYKKGMLQLTDNPLRATYSNHKEAFIGLKTGFKTKGFAAGADAKYSYYTKGKRYGGYTSDKLFKGQPAGYPPFEANFYAETNINEKLYIGANLYARSATPASPFLFNGNKTKYNGYADLGVYAQYVIDNHFTAYINGGNLLNAKRINYGMYVERGVNVGLGLLVKF